MDKTKKLEKISKEIENCSECKKNKVGKAVVGEGDPDADIVFIGEAPGRTEAETGRPFVGRSGKLLRKLINEAGLKEKDVYITSPVKYLPIYVTPTPQDIAHGKTHLDRQIKIIDPKIIVLLGNVAVQGVLSRKVQASKEHGRIIEEHSRKYFITVHPAAALRFKKFKVLLEEDFKNLKKLLA
ncbi:MAG: uracil-DNA glycosylase family protein [Candidatus Levyibacteriota bacterium]